MRYAYVIKWLIQKAVGYSYDMIGVFGIRHSVSERAAGRLAVNTVYVTEPVTGRSRNEGSIDVKFASFYCPCPSPVSSEDGGFLQQAALNVAAEPSPGAARVDGREHSCFEEGKQHVLYKTQGTCGYRQVFKAFFCKSVHNLENHRVPVAQGVVEGNSHAILEFGSIDDFVQW